MSDADSPVNLSRLRGCIHHSPTDPRLLRVEPLESGEAHADRGRLAAESGNVFATNEWLDAWWRQLGRGRTRHDLGVRDPSGRLVAVLPLLAHRIGPATVLRSVGYLGSDELGPVCAPVDRAVVGTALRVASRSGMLGRRAIVLERAPADAGWVQMLEGIQIHWEASPVLQLTAADFDAWLSSRSRNTRAEFRKKRRRLERSGTVTVRRTTSIDTLDADLTGFRDLHLGRWGSDQGFPDALWSVHRSFALAALQRDWLRLFFLEVDGRAVAAWYGFEFAGSLWFYQGGRDRAWDRWSVLRLLTLETIRFAFERDLDRYRFLRGGEAYKYRDATSDPGLTTFVAGPRASAWTVAAGARAASRLPPGLRRRVFSGVNT